LISDKQRINESTRQAARQEAARIETLAREGKELEALIARLMKESAASTQAALRAKRLDEARKAADLARLEAARRKIASGQANAGNTAMLSVTPEKQTDSTRSSGQSGATTTLGKVRIPANGKVVRAMENFPTFPKAVALQTKPEAWVRAPSAGKVLYAGPFRSYGTLVMLDAGGGYTWVLAGLGTMTITKGQIIIAGEPIGKMGITRVAAARASALGSNAPLLYVELRKNGKPIDPAGVWAAGSEERPVNDS
ncbi:MAG: peptidoglycan DD-metalloendopeptidase family protein, partial [Pseudomonadota bacterium]